MNDMKKDLIDFKTAKELSKLNYDKACSFVFTNDGREKEYNGKQYTKNSLNKLKEERGIVAHLRPTRSALRRWICDNYNVEIEISRININDPDYKQYFNRVRWFNQKPEMIMLVDGNSYDEAFDYCLHRSLEAIQKFKHIPKIKDFKTF